MHQHLAAVVTSALIGASKVEQLDATLGVLAQSTFSPEELHHIDEVLRS
ncbi:MAG: hypothetical protein R2880_19420 [Deinococcales bacterium]